MIHKIAPARLSGYTHPGRPFGCDRTGTRQDCVWQSAHHSIRYDRVGEAALTYDPGALSLLARHNFHPLSLWGVSAGTRIHDPKRLTG